MAFPPPSLVPIGALLLWGRAIAPTYWLICDGSPFNSALYPRLYNYLGAAVLPDYRDCFPLGAGSKALGSKGGAMGHTHKVDPPNTTSGPHSGSPTIGISLLGLGTAAPTPHTHDVNIAQFDSGAADPPYVALNFIIRAL